MRKIGSKQSELILGLLLVVVAQGCGTESTGTAPTTTGYISALTTEETTGQPDESTVPAYLEETILPCTPIDGSTTDPCEPGEPTYVYTINGGSEGLPDPLTTITDLFLGRTNVDYPTMYPSLLPHIVVRGTVRPGTIRCEDYPVRAPNFLSYPGNEDIVFHVHCFGEVRINEYLAGDGPPELTVSLHREGIALPITDGYRENVIATHGGEDKWVDNAFDNPAQRTADVYEGKELVLFLRIPATIAVETWATSLQLSLWFVQRTGDNPPRAVSREMRLAITPEQRAQLDIPLTDLERQIKEAAKARIAVTEGRIGTNRSLPLLVTDANQLSTYYEAVGAVYDNPEQAPKTPPPVPGSEQPPAPPANTGESQQPQTPSAPGEDTQPPDSTP